MPRNHTPQMLVVLTLVLGACARVGMIDDGTTVSFGDAYAGSLHAGIMLPPQGPGYWVPRRWRRRGNQWGTDELVALIMHTGRRLAGRLDGARVGVADLSARRGAHTVWHQSHQSGRDVDLLLFAVDRRGRPLPTGAMVRFRADGTSRPIDSHGHRRSWRRFDAHRNWLLVRTLLEDTTVDIQHLYLYAPLADLLLAHAAAMGEPPWLRARAAALLEQPVDALPHDDHLHVRIYCPDNDRDLGCVDGDTRTWSQRLRARMLALRAHLRAFAVAIEAAMAPPTRSPQCCAQRAEATRDRRNRL